MSKLLRADTAVWLLVVGVFLYAVGTLPGVAHGAPLAKEHKAPPPPKNHVNPDGTAVIYIYPKPVPPQQGEVVVKSPPATDETSDIA